MVGSNAHKSILQIYRQKGSEGEKGSIGQKGDGENMEARRREGPGITKVCLIFYSFTLLYLLETNLLLRPEGRRRREEYGCVRTLFAENVKTKDRIEHSTSRLSRKK